MSNGITAENPYMISGIDIHPQYPDVVFASFTNGSVYATEDGGESWREIVSGLDRVFGVRLVPSE